MRRLMYTGSKSPAFWKEYLFSLLAPYSKETDSSGIQLEKLEDLTQAGKLLVQLRINNLLKHVAKPPVPLPDPRRCAHQWCPLGWLKNVYVVVDHTVRSAALSIKRTHIGEKKVLEYLIQVNPTAFPPDQKYLNMVVAHEIAHLLFIRERPGGELVQYLNLKYSPGKTKAEWLVYELAREVVAPTRLLARHLIPLSDQRPALTQLIRTSQIFGIPEQELVGALLHSNAYLSWLKINPDVRAQLVENSYVSKSLLEVLPNRAASPLSHWAKSLVIIVAFPKRGAPRVRKYIGKFWRQAAGFIPNEGYRIPRKVQAGLVIERLVTQCAGWLDLASTRWQNPTPQLLLFDPIEKRSVLSECPELGKLARQWKFEHVIEIMVRGTPKGHRTYILVRPRQCDSRGQLLKPAKG